VAVWSAEARPVKIPADPIKVLKANNETLDLFGNVG
jgi:hypothetical protein